MLKMSFFDPPYHAWSGFSRPTPSIYLWNLYSAPSRQLLRSAPSPGPGKREGLKETIKRARKITWKRYNYSELTHLDRTLARYSPHSQIPRDQNATNFQTVNVIPSFVHSLQTFI